MASSTSHSDTRLPRWALQLAAVAVATWAVCAGYTLRLNPEIQFYRSGHWKKQQWMTRLRADYRTNILIFGGSSCATSIQGSRLVAQHDLPVANLGLGAGMGTPVLTHYALDALQPGDTLIVALEQGMLINPVEMEPMGVQFALAIGQPALARREGRIDWPAALIDLRPGGYHAFTLLGKFLFRQPLYRYVPADFKSDGWQEVNDRRPFDVPALAASKPAPSILAWLAGVRDECARRQARIALTIPWQYCAPEDRVATQRINLIFLRELCAVLPVLREASFGTHSIREHFGDTLVHTTPEGAALRTDEFAAAIKAWNLWTIAELDATLASWQ